MKNTALPLAALLFALSANATTQLTSHIANNSKSYRVHDNNTLMYDTQVSWHQTGLDLQVLQGHASQLGRLSITHSKVIAFDSTNRMLWQDKRSSLPICIPELFPEFAKAYFKELKAGKSIKCHGPIIKAKKLAPFKFELIAETSNSLIIEVGPGSIGMMFFMDSITMTLNKDATHLQDFSGILPAPERLLGKMAYLEVKELSQADYPIATIDKAVFAGSKLNTNSLN